MRPHFRGFEARRERPAFHPFAAAALHQDGTRRARARRAQGPTPWGEDHGGAVSMAMGGMGGWMVD
jgi:hypothetical protein